MGLDAYFPFRDLPWLRGLLAWCFAGAALWLLAALLSAIVRPVVVEASRGLQRLCDLLGRRADSARQGRAAARDADRARAARSHVYVSLSADDYAVGAAAHARTAAALEVLGDRLRRFAEELSLAVRGVGEIGGQLQKLGDSAFEQIQWATRDLRVARAQLLMSTVLLICLVAVNTGMLSEILKALDIGSRLQYRGVQLTYVFAFLLTLAEAGIGFLHGVFSEPTDRDERRLRLGTTFTAIGAVLVAAVEGSFYGRIGQNREPLLLVDVEIPMPLAFFAWGFVLVLLLFGLGMVWYRALSITRSGSVHAAIRKQLRALTGSADAGRRVLGEVEQVRKQASQGVGSAAAMMNESGAASTAAAPVVFTVDDMRTLELRSGLWALLAVVSAGAFYLVWHQTITSLYPGLEAWAGRAVAAGHMALFFTAGLLMRPIESAVERQAVQGRGFGHLRNALGSIFCLGIAGVGFAVIAYQAWRAGWGAGSLLSLPMAMALMFAGRELSGLIGLLGFVMRSVGHAFLRLLDLALVFLVRAISIALVVIEFVLNVLMAPLRLFMSNFRRNEPASHVDGDGQRARVHERRDTFPGTDARDGAIFDADHPALKNADKRDLEVQ